MSTPRKPTPQEQFDDRLEDYFSSEPGTAFMFGMFADFLRSPDGVSLVREIVSADDGSAGTLSTATPSQNRTRPLKKARHDDADLTAKWTDLLAEPSKTWRYNSIETIRGRGHKLVITKTADHLYSEMLRFASVALDQANQVRFKDDDEHYFVLLYILHDAVQRMRCNMRYEAAVVLIDWLGKRYHAQSPDVADYEQQVLALVKKRALAPIPENLEFDPKTIDA